MANSKRPLDPDYLFNIFRLNKWFAIASVFLLVSFLAMVKYDYDREWKHWQRKFRSIEIEKTNAAIQEAQTALDGNTEYQAAVTALAAAKAEVEKQGLETFKLQKDHRKLEAAKYAAEKTYQDRKSILDALRYDLEEAKHEKSASTKKLQMQFDRVQKQVEFDKVVFEKVDKDFLEVEGKIKATQAVLNQATDALNKLRADRDRLTLKAEKIGRSFVNDLFRDAPLLDFIDPSLRVREIVLRDLQIDYNFTKIPRADSCVTCHVAIDKKGFEDQPNPLKTHPQLDKFLSSTSPHPTDTFGCTVCHLGQGGGLTFTNAGHTPKDEKQQEEWEKKYHWHPLHHWSEPMLASANTEATCNGCHAADVDIPGSTQLAKGVQLAEHSGCYGCHKIEGWEKVRKTGPSLKRVASKVSQDWMFNWIKNPKSFRPTTNMPRLFDLSNNNDPASLIRNNVAVTSIVTYLRTKAEPYEPTSISLAGGNSEKGKELFGSVGCLGCHAIDDFPKVAPPVFAPDLSQVGSKLSPSWLAAWIKNPKEYWPETRMPSLRITDDELRNLVAYLVTKKNPAFEALKVPTVDRQAIGKTAFEFLRRRMSAAEAQAKLKAMSEEERTLFLGERFISHYGCFGCHEIGGFEDAKPIGTELTLEGSKPLVRFDFGLTDIEKTVPSWVQTKLLTPRVYDQGKIKDFGDRLRMPQFDFTHEEAEALTTFVMGLRKYDISPDRKPAPTPFRVAARQGRRLIRDSNCRGCHTIENQGGVILGHYEDPTLGPPNLVGEGAKIQPNWLFHFIQGPTPIRPWLKIRMPTFGFNDDQINTIIRYFRGLDKQTLDWESPPKIVQTAEQRKQGAETFAALQCAKCHVVGAIPEGVETSNLAPNFKLAKDRLRYDWFDDWLRDPQKMLPGTRMPNFFYYENQAIFPDAEPKITAVRDYIYTLQ